MVKVYYAYEFSHPVAQFVSTTSNLQILTDKHSNRSFLVSGVNQYVTLISLKTGEVLKYLTCSNSMVKHVAAHDNRVYAGYQDGLLVCFSILDSTTLNYQIEYKMDAHSAPISYITWPVHNQDSSSHILFTGSANGNIIIYDTLSQETEKIKSAHKSAITQLQSASLMINGSIKQCLISVGKDGYLKVWDLTNLLCLGVVGMLGQALTMHLDWSRNIAYVGMDNQKIHIIKFLAPNRQQGLDDGQNSSKICSLVGTIVRNNYSRSLQMIAEHKTLYILNSDKSIEVYQKQSQSQINKKRKRLTSRKKEKAQKQQMVQEQLEQPQQLEQQQEINQYELSLKLITQKALLQKFHSFVIKKSQIYLNNGSNIYCFKLQQLTNSAGSSMSKLTHSTGKTYQLQMEYPFVVSRSQKQCTVYPYAILENQDSQLFKSSNRSKPQKLFTIEEDHQIKWCKLFNQGFLMMATQKSVCIYDLAKNQQVYLQEEQWQGCWVRGNNCLLWRDNLVGKFQIGYNKQKQIQMKLVSEHKFPEKITEASALNQSFNKYFLNLQNNTILMNYSDTHKHFLTFHGHKLPILSFSIAADDNVMATGSIDKDIRLWDLQFGHCIKTLFAHKSPVTAVQFVKDTHYLWTGGRDGLIKMWDMDSYELIIELDQVLNGEVKDIKISSNGQQLIAGGIDGGLRVWQKGQNQIVAGDQQEKNKEKIVIEEYAMDKIRKFGAQNNQRQDEGQNPENKHYADDNPQKIRYDDLKHGEQLIQALQNKEHPTKLIELLKKIAPTNLKSSLSFLHRSHVDKLENYLEFLIKQNYEVELCYRVIDGLSHNTIYNVLGGLHNKKGINLRITDEQNRQETLGKILRKRWQQEMRILRVNKQMFRLLGRSLKEQKQFL